MRLIWSDIDFNSETEFEEGKVLSVESANLRLFSRLVHALREDSEIAYILENEKRLNLEQESCIICDYFNLVDKEKAILNKLHKDVEKLYQGDEEIIKLVADVEIACEKALGYICSSYNIDFEWRVPDSLGEYLKFLSFKPNGGFSSSCDGLLNLIETIAKIKLYKVVILVNAKSFFEPKQIQEIMKVCVYSGQRVIFLDNINTPQTYECEKKILIDEDCYDILLNRENYPSDSGSEVLISSLRF